jgi:hypothetical protein
METRVERPIRFEIFSKLFPANINVAYRGELASFDLEHEKIPLRSYPTTTICINDIDDLILLVKSLGEAVILSIESDGTPILTIDDN